MAKCHWCGKEIKGEVKKSYGGKSTTGKVATFFSPFSREFCCTRCVKAWENSKK